MAFGDASQQKGQKSKRTTEGRKRNCEEGKRARITWRQVQIGYGTAGGKRERVRQGAGGSDLVLVLGIAQVLQLPGVNVRRVGLTGGKKKNETGREGVTQCSTLGPSGRLSDLPP